MPRQLLFADAGMEYFIKIIYDGRDREPPKYFVRGVEIFPLSTTVNFGCFAGDTMGPLSTTVNYSNV